MAKTISDLAFYYQVTGEWTNEMQAAIPFSQKNDPG